MLLLEIAGLIEYSISMKRNKELGSTGEVNAVGVSRLLTD